MITEKQYLEAIDVVKKYREQLYDQVISIDNILSAEAPIHHTRMSVRLYNILCNISWILKKNEIKGTENFWNVPEIRLIDVAHCLTEEEFLKYHRAGKKSLIELKLILNDAGLKMRQK